MKIHHIGIAVSSLEAARAAFEDLLGKPPDSEEMVRGAEGARGNV